MNVSVTGSDTLLDESVSDTGSDPTTFGRSVYQFTADSVSATIEFTDTSSETLSVDAVLDQVGVRVPSVSGFGIVMLSGLVGFAGMRKLRA
jgi:hypothetical protein